MRAKHKPVSEIVAVLKRQKRRIYQVLARGEDFKQKSRSGAKTGSSKTCLLGIIPFLKLKTQL